MNRKKRPDILNGSIKGTITRMAIGMVPGMLAMSAFNAVDTFFVGRLGAEELAAMSFTFPIVMVFSSIALGLGVGLSSTVSRALGQRDMSKVKSLTTNGLLLSFLIVLVLGTLGVIFTEPIFIQLGATGETLEFIKQYMIIWFIGTPFVVIPMAGNNVIRATGDTATASNIMMASVFVNIILDPLLIFGIGPFPEMGIAGAALATVIARFTTLIFSLSILIFREKLVEPKKYPLKEVFSNWKAILFVGLPAGLVQAANPVTLGIITRMLSKFGDNVVAGFGTASKMEMLMLIIPISVSSVMAPFSGQNFGGKKFDRIQKGINFASIISLSWGVLLFVVLQFAAGFIVSLFNSDPEIVAAGSSYLRIVGFSYGFLGLMNICSQSLSAMNKPLESAVITIFKTLVLNVPLAIFGAYLFNELGVFSATFIANIIGGIVAFFVVKALLLKNKNAMSPE